MHYYFITGSSSGIGKALALALLEEDNTVVYGISRTQSINHRNYKHVALDLSSQAAVIAFRFPNLVSPNRVVLVNNAGTLGTVTHLGELDSQEIAGALNVNLVAPTILANAFMATYKLADSTKLIINITSGAATSPYDGWSVYCTGKAGIDMLSRVAAHEQQLGKKHPTTILAIAPGVVDTAMQNQLRSTDSKGFSRKQKFVDLKAKNQLYPPEAVAQRLVEIIKNPAQVGDVVSRIEL